MSLFIRIWLSFLITLGAILLLLYTAIQWSFDNGLIRYINQREAATYQTLSHNIATFYVLSEEPSLLEQNPFYWRQLLALSEEREALTEARLNDWNIEALFEPDRPPRKKHHDKASRGTQSERERKPPRKPPPNDHLPVSLLSNDMHAIYGPYKPDFNVLPVKVNGAVIAHLAWPASRIPASSYDVAFAESQKHAFLILALLALTLGAVLALFFSRRFTRPLIQVANTTQKLTLGDYQARTALSGHDEIATLGKNINRLAVTLEQAETARRDWLASTAHELRTPLSIIKGEFEAILDGIRPANESTLASIEEEIAHLQKLIEDLYELTNADIGAIRYQLAPLNLSTAVAQVCQKHSSLLLNKGITLTENIADRSIIVNADETRIQQLLENLLSNCEKYTDQPGSIRVSLATCENHALLHVEDSAPGVPDEALHRLFEKLFRVESSRNRQHGGSGLGLAVVKKIVEGHGGTIVAKHSQLGGLKLAIELPLLKQ
ncbi:ATP-binding protein [Enterovibrio sp. ZSDZ35]|uniref:histidine kinase n=1 Tax=Enterovibrio qingdaonensis TaxID=2899818 RepID=A0ABT5QJ77_9GAMM|nr:ATP-binding protein [Enterovibrio sp. ZSDZ35]MDD1781042.1 ATP-binding protein [Enterovibrio sp. ZSDZ35]